MPGIEGADSVDLVVRHFCFLFLSVAKLRETGILPDGIIRTLVAEYRPQLPLPTSTLQDMIIKAGMREMAHRWVVSRPFSI